MPTIFTPEQQAAYEREGYVLVRGLFDAQEAGILRAAIEQDPQMRASLYDRKDADGKATRENGCLQVLRGSHLEQHHPRYTPPHKVSDNAVREAGVKFAVGEDANFRKTFGNPPELKRRMEPAVVETPPRAGQ